MIDELSYPIGIQTFSKIREENFVYIDKTQYIMRLVNKSGYYFLSRPRRFGKSLFLSTLKAYFEGKRDLFRGLAIDRDDVDWTPRPVIDFSLNTIDAKTEQAMYELFSAKLDVFERDYGCNEEVTELSRRLESVIINAYQKTGRKAVVLIDEYDAPLLSTIEKPELNSSYRETLKSIFSVLKSADPYIQFAFITGVSRFGHTSLFSGANNLQDISMTDEYAAVCGITEGELKLTLMPGITTLAEKLKVSPSDAMALLKENYDGYHFSADSPDIYNPFSVLCALNQKMIRDYWFQSGTPTYLIDMLKKDGFYLPDLDCLETMQSALGMKESYLNNPIALLFETGYLTIKEYDDETMIYTLGLPNKEVSVSLSEALLPIFADMTEMEAGALTTKLRKAVVNGEPERFMQLLKTFFEGNPYSNTEIGKRERYFKNNLYLVCKALGFKPETERETCRGRMDMVLKTRRYIYIFELKTDGSAQSALEQIEDKGYALPFAEDGRHIIKIGAVYSSTDNNIDSWQISQDAD